MEHANRTLIRQAMKKKAACYVLISCEEPDSSGEMNVELVYEGDETLASFLVENAQIYFDDKMSESIENC